jgi:hypothetical protein
MSARYVVFLGNKLISCDSIVPVMMELHARTGERSLLVTTDRGTYNSIRANIVLNDAINGIGSLLFLGRNGPDIRESIRYRLFALNWLIRTAMRALMGRHVFVHFRALAEWPLRILYLANPSRTFWFEADNFGESELMLKVGMLVRARLRGRDSIERPVYRSAGKLVAFQPNWSRLKEEHPDVPRYVIGPSRTRAFWISHLVAESDRYFRDAFAAAKIAPSDRIIAVMLGWLGEFPQLRKSSQSAIELLEETLSVLASEHRGLPIFLKPHVFTDMKIVRSMLSNYPDTPFMISYLHPGVLATRATFFICNHYTTTLADASSLGVPTIEYTAYSDEVLEITSNGSMRPEFVTHFINEDTDRLRLTVRSILDQAHGKRQLPTGEAGDASGAFAELCR